MEKATDRSKCLRRKHLGKEMHMKKKAITSKLTQETQQMRWKSMPLFHTECKGRGMGGGRIVYGNFLKSLLKFG